MVTLTKNAEDVVDDLLQSLANLRTHDFIAKQQAAFLVETKANIKEGEAVVLADVSENFSFVIQDAIQGFHWSNDQATLHPFVVYWRQDSSDTPPQPGTSQETTLEGSLQPGTSQNAAQSNASQ